VTLTQTPTMGGEFSPEPLPSIVGRYVGHLPDCDPGILLERVQFLNGEVVWRCPQCWGAPLVELIS